MLYDLDVFLDDFLAMVRVVSSAAELAHAGEHDDQENAAANASADDESSHATTTSAVAITDIDVGSTSVVASIIPRRGSSNHGSSLDVSALGLSDHAGALGIRGAPKEKLLGQEEHREQVLAV